MSVEKLKQSILNLGNALMRLDEVLQQSPNEFIIDATIQRFEFCIELFWKTLKRQLAYEGIETTTPRETIKHCYQIGWLKQESIWIDMLNDRNHTSHIYNEEMARQIYGRIEEYQKELTRMHSFIIERNSGMLN